MAVPTGAILTAGPFVSLLSELPPATAELRDTDAVIFHIGRWWRVSSAGDAWEPAEGERT